MLNTSLIKKLENQLNKKPRKKKETEIFELPKAYVEGLSKEDAKKKTENVKETKKLLKEGRKEQAFELAKKRPTVKSNKQSSYTIRFKKKFPNIKVGSKEWELKTGIPVSVQKEILKRGMGAFASAGSRASVSSPRAWSISRLYAFYFKGIENKLDFDRDLEKKVKFKK